MGTKNEKLKKPSYKELDQQLFNRNLEYEGAVAQYDKVVSQNRSLQSDLRVANEQIKIKDELLESYRKKYDELNNKNLQLRNDLIGKDAKIATMRQGCPPEIVNDACGIVYSIYCQWKNQDSNVKQFIALADALQDKLMKTGKLLQDFQNGADLWGQDKLQQHCNACDLVSENVKKDKVIEEYSKLCRRLTSSCCRSLEHAHGMIKAFNKHTTGGTTSWQR